MTGGVNAAQTRIIIQHADDSWSEIQLDDTGAILSVVRQQPTRNQASRRLRAALNWELRPFASERIIGPLGLAVPGVQVLRSASAVGKRPIRSAR